MKYPSIIAIFLLSVAFVPGVDVRAETTPVTRCVTQETKTLHASTVKRMDTDIQPYLNRGTHADAISAYRQTVTTAWAAMEEPYCGYGREGANSSKKSYVKTVTRARSAFLTAVKTSLTKTAAAPEPSPVASSTLQAATASRVVTSSEKKTTTRRAFSSRLVRGVRSSDVLELQRRLLSYFGEPITDNNATGYFGTKTHELVVQFQLKKKIIASRSDAAAGIVGPKTLRALNGL